MTIPKVALLFYILQWKKMRRIRPIFDIEKLLWKSELCCFRPSILERRKGQKYILYMCIVLSNFFFFSGFATDWFKNVIASRIDNSPSPPKKWKVLPLLNGLKMYAHCCPRPWPRLTWLIEPRPIPSTLNVTSWGIRPKNQNVCDHPLLPLLLKKRPHILKHF